MNDTEIDDLLKRVQRVDPPPFLFTRIEARLADGIGARVPRARLVVVACGLALVLLANVALIGQNENDKGPSAVGEVLDDMGMNASNQLYR